MKDGYRRYLDGDDGGMTEIIQEYRDGLILYLNGITDDLYAAEDLAEETFVKLAVKKPRDKGGAAFKTWLYRIGRNLAIDYLRRNRERPGLNAELAEEQAADRESLENAFLREERRIAVHRAMERLNTDQRQVLWLLYFEGLSAKAAAKVLKRSPHATEALASRARKALKEILKQEGITDAEEL